MWQYIKCFIQIITWVGSSPTPQTSPGHYEERKDTFHQNKALLMAFHMIGRKIQDSRLELCGPGSATNERKSCEKIHSSIEQWNDNKSRLPVTTWQIQLYEFVFLSKLSKWSMWLYVNRTVFGYSAELFCLFRCPHSVNAVMCHLSDWEFGFRCFNHMTGLAPISALLCV